METEITDQIIDKVQLFIARSFKFSYDLHNTVT